MYVKAYKIKSNTLLLNAQHNFKHTLIHLLWIRDNKIASQDKTRQTQCETGSNIMHKNASRLEAINNN